MDRAKVVFLALVWLAVVVALIVWVQALNRRIGELESAVDDLAARMERLEGRGRFERAQPRVRAGPPRKVTQPGRPGRLRRPDRQGRFLERPGVVEGPKVPRVKKPVEAPIAPAPAKEQVRP